MKAAGGEDIGYAGDALKGKRHRADYGLEKNFTYDPEKIVEEAEELFELVLEQAKGSHGSSA